LVLHTQETAKAADFI